MGGGRVGATFLARGGSGEVSGASISGWRSSNLSLGYRRCRRISVTGGRLGCHRTAYPPEYTAESF